MMNLFDIEDAVRYGTFDDILEACGITKEEFYAEEEQTIDAELKSVGKVRCKQ